MHSFTWAGLAGRLVRSVKRVARALSETARAVWQRIRTWHRRRLAQDPHYPLALAAISGVVIRLVVPHRWLRDILMEALEQVLIGRGGWVEPEEEWA
jgi:hypothetical protein